MQPGRHRPCFEPLLDVLAKAWRPEGFIQRALPSGYPALLPTRAPFYVGGHHPDTYLGRYVFADTPRLPNQQPHSQPQHLQTGQRCGGGYAWYSTLNTRWDHFAACLQHPKHDSGYVAVPLRDGGKKTRQASSSTSRQHRMSLRNHDRVALQLLFWSPRVPQQMQITAVSGAQTSEREPSEAFALDDSTWGGGRAAVLKNVWMEGCRASAVSVVAVM